jgi:predicted nucleotidyltransferase
VAAPNRPLRAGEILEVLVRGGVEFVLVGGIAVQAHGYIRSTRDVDIVPSPAPDAARRLSQALAALEAEEVGRNEHLTRFETRAGRLDVIDLEEIAGTPRSFEKLRSRALVVNLGGIEIPVAGLDDLVRMKRAAGRPHDLTDIGALTRDDEELEREAREST